MSKEFFDNLGKTISKVASEAVVKTEDFFAVTKIKGKMAEERRLIEKICRNIGHEVYKEYKAGTAFSEVLAELCKDIEKHEEEIRVQQKNLELYNTKKEDVKETADEEVFEEAEVEDLFVDEEVEQVSEEV